MIVTKTDTVLQFNKPQALFLSNSLLKKREFMERLTFSLRREEALLELWENTSAQLKAQEELNKNLESQIDKLNKVILADRDEMDRLKKNTADLKRQSYGKGMTLGVVVGVVGTLVALVVIN